MPAPLFVLPKGPRATLMDNYRNIVPPVFESGPGWTKIVMPTTHLKGRSFIDGDPDGYRLRLAMFSRDTDKRLFARVWFGPEAEGPPGHAHGGAMAAVLDHLMGVGGWIAGHPVVAARISVEFRRPIPLCEVITGESWVDSVDGKKVYARGRLYIKTPDNPYTESEGLFIRQHMERFRGLISRPPLAE